MPQAVRVGDIGSHGNVMLNGSPNVVINGARAHRSMDLFVCPVHGIGVSSINPSGTVFYNGLGAVKVGSAGIDSGGVTVNVGGSPTVNVDPA